jgi:hypothetical protein
MPLLAQSEKSWGKTVQPLPRRLKNIPMTRKVVVQVILITPVNSGPHAKPKSCVEWIVRIHQRINVAYALNAHFTVRILQKTFALSKTNRRMFVMDAVSFPNVHF